MAYNTRMLVLILILLQLMLAVFLFYICISFVIGAPYVPSSRRTATAMIKAARIKKNDVIYDLGSGDGNLLFRAAEQGADARGIEINPILVLVTSIRKRLHPHGTRVTVRWKNMWHTPLGDADMVFVYLIPQHMKRLEKKLQEECKPGTTIISNSFVFEGFRKRSYDPTTHVYVYTI